MIINYLAQRLPLVLLFAMLHGQNGHAFSSGIHHDMTAAIRRSSHRVILSSSSKNIMGMQTDCIPNENRREFVMSFMTSLGVSGSIMGAQPASAAYGEMAKQELPNYIEFLIQKNKVVDPDSFLYKGPDPNIQLERLLDASKRLKDIPPLAEAKKWSQVQGILTGPLGTLTETLNRISKDGTADVQAKGKKVKEDIFAINAAASQKSTDGVISKTSAASGDLEAFVKAAF